MKTSPMTIQNSYNTGYYNDATGSLVSLVLPRSSTAINLNNINLICYLPLPLLHHLPLTSHSNLPLSDISIAPSLSLSLSFPLPFAFPFSFSLTIYIRGFHYIQGYIPLYTVLPFPLPLLLHIPTTYYPLPSAITTP